MFDIRTDPRRRCLVVVPLGVVALMGLAACGTSGGSADNASTSASTSAAAGNGGPRAAQRAAFRTCMANNGVTLPDRPARRAGSGQMTGGGNGTPPSGVPAAPPNGGQGGGPGGGPGRGLTQPPPGVDATKWTAAMKACSSLAPTPPGGAASSATAGS
jgi:hypothetical protein